MSRDFLGVGWKFPVTVNESNGLVEMSEYEEDIKEAIWIILSTQKGERLMQPEFGCGIRDYVFEYLDVTTTALIQSSVREALAKWESRIEVLNVDISMDKAIDGKLLINIGYLVRKTNNRFNLVYPFYIKES